MVLTDMTIEQIVPFGVGSEDTPGVTEKRSCHTERRDLWVLSRWREIREFAAMVSPSQTLAPPQATSLCIPDCVFHDAQAGCSSTRSIDEKPAFRPFGVNRAHFATLTNQAIVVRCRISKHLLG